MDFARLSERFGNALKVDGLPEEWVSPYRLLWGAAYSIGIAERSMVKMGGHGVLVPPDLAPYLKTAIEDERTVSWFPLWHASYMLTNAIYRVAAAAEKICYLAAQQPQEDRRWLWDAVRNQGSPLSKKIPKAHGLLKGMPGGPNRAAFLQAQRQAFLASGTVTLPLVCAFIQTDIDKHVAYWPRKELMFDDHLASGAFLEACDLWDAAAALA